MKNDAGKTAAFLAQAGWNGARHMPLRADFSARRFTRLQRDESTPPSAVLMEADKDQKTEPFVAIANLLRTLEISAPEIYAADTAGGLVLMEDFGDRNIGRMLDAGENAEPLYRRAVDMLVHLHKSFRPAAGQNLDLPAFGGALFASQAELFLDAWLPIAKGREATLEEAEGFRAAWKQALKGIETLPQTLMLRDFMPDNLMDLTDLSGREKGRSIGVLDFQDGGIGPIAYDLASLCEVVRRDGTDGTKRLDEMTDYYHAQAAPKLSQSELRRACRILAAQRHTRILGILARRAQGGQPDKLAYAPRIWEYLGELMQDEALTPFKKWVEAYILPQGLGIKT